MLIGQKASARTLRRDQRGDRKNVAPMHAEGDNHDISTGGCHALAVSGQAPHWAEGAVEEILTMQPADGLGLARLLLRRSPYLSCPRRTAPVKAFIEPVERLEEEKKAIADDIRDVYAEAKGSGFDVKALRAIVRLRKQDTDERREQQAILETYMHALGMH
jgi:uncharacterized protein (UPF0335 family)